MGVLRAFGYGLAPGMCAVGSACVRRRPSGIGLRVPVVRRSCTAPIVIKTKYYDKKTTARSMLLAARVVCDLWRIGIMPGHTASRKIAPENCHPLYLCYVLVYGLSFSRKRTTIGCDISKMSRRLLRPRWLASAVPCNSPLTGGFQGATSCAAIRTRESWRSSGG